MKLYALLISILFFGTSLKAEEFTQYSRIASIQMKRLPSGERFALVTLEKAAANPEKCEKANGMQFALDLSNLEAKEILRHIGDSFFENNTLSFVIEGCSFGYPGITKVKFLPYVD